MDYKFKVGDKVKLLSTKNPISAQWYIDNGFVGSAFFVVGIVKPYADYTFPDGGTVGRWDDDKSKVYYVINCPHQQGKTQILVTDDQLELVKPKPFKFDNKQKEHLQTILEHVLPFWAFSWASDDVNKLINKKIEQVINGTYRAKPSGGLDMILSAPQQERVGAKFTA